MSTCTIGHRPFFTAIFFLLFASSLLAGNGTVREESIPLFPVTGSSGEVRNSTELFFGQRVVLVVTGRVCLGLEPFLAWRERLPVEKAHQALILCVGGTPKEAGAVIWLAADDATKALGITGTPMLLGIEENSVKWRIAGFINRWQGLASNWLESFDKREK